MRLFIAQVCASVLLALGWPGQSQGGIEIGLAAGIDRAETREELVAQLVRRLVWRVDSGSSPALISGTARLAVVRLERGRVTASLQSQPGILPRRTAALADALGQEALRRVIDCCLADDDPPVSIRALSGRAFLDADGLERGIAGIARRGIANGIFFIEPPARIDWGRQIVLVLAAVSEEVPTRPLILVLERL